jgi:hypothetical protein
MPGMQTTATGSRRSHPVISVAPLPRSMELPLLSSRARIVKYAGMPPFQAPPSISYHQSRISALTTLCGNRVLQPLA